MIVRDFITLNAGVLYDPFGLKQTELERLANSRLPVSHFNPKLIHPAGFFVSVLEQGI